tara:strand:- start:1372 stop:1596 length:225 start_codon:yes stop_codon:yes gene_type:complete
MMGKLYNSDDPFILWMMRTLYGSALKNRKHRHLLCLRFCFSLKDEEVVGLVGWCKLFIGIGLDATFTAHSKIKV